MGLFDAITNALTPSGTSEANRDRNRKGNAQKIGVDLLGAIRPSLMKSADLFNSTFPQAAQAYKNIFSLASPGGVQRKVAGTRGELLGQAREQSRRMSSSFGDAGGIGLEQGLKIGGENAANQTANDLFTYFQSPQGQAELSNMILELQRRFPGLDVYQALDAIIQNRQAPQVGASPINGIASAASLFMGNPFGGGGGGGVPFIGSGSSPRLT